MKRWALLVAGLYLLALVVLTVPVMMAAFVPGAKPIFTLEEIPQTAKEVYMSWRYWVCILVMVVGQLALLATPVAVAQRRPVTHRSLWLPTSVAGLMLGALVISAWFSLDEFARQEQAVDQWLWKVPVKVGIVTWGVWSVVFYRLNRNAIPSDVISRQCRLLLKGSILELLIAVPTHLAARSRDYCCAGAMTFIGLTTGISVMLFSFGPAVFFLYVARWRRLHPETATVPVK